MADMLKIDIGRRLIKFPSFLLREKMGSGELRSPLNKRKIKNDPRNTRNTRKIKKEKGGSTRAGAGLIFQAGIAIIHLLEEK